MRVLEYLVPPEWDGRSVRDFVRQKLGFSARMLAKQKRVEGGILKNGAPCRSSGLLRAGDILAFSLPEETKEYPAVPAELSILWETGDFLAVDKPARMPIHPSPGHDRDSLLNAVAYYYRETGQNLLFRPLFRLDKDTSGIVLLAKHRAASSAQLEKRYFGVCEGTLSGSGTIDAPIGLREGSKILRECGHGDPAVTHWRALAAEEGHTLLSFRLETGRTHQIRVHMASLGHCLAGDDLYGGSRDKIQRQALHCGWAGVSCPALSAGRELVSEFPPDFRAAFPWLPEIREMLETIEKED